MGLAIRGQWRLHHFSFISYSNFLKNGVPPDSSVGLSKNADVINSYTGGANFDIFLKRIVVKTFWQKNEGSTTIRSKWGGW